MTPALQTSSPAYLYLARLGPGSRRAQHQALRRIAGLLWPAEEPVVCLGEAGRWGAITPDQCVALRARVAADYAPATARRILSALRGVVKEAWRVGLISNEARARMSDLPAIAGERLPAGRCLSDAELQALRYSADARDRALLAVMVGAGVRRHEVSRVSADAMALPIAMGTADDRQGHGRMGISLGGICPCPCLSGSGEVHGASAIRLLVSGKGGKQRICYIAGALACDLRTWLETSPDPLFSLSGAGVWKALSRLASRAGVPPFAPHDLRRTYASRALDAGVDLVTVQASMGHADPRTTARYDRRGEDALREAAFRIAMPREGAQEPRRAT